MYILLHFLTSYYNVFIRFFCPPLSLLVLLTLILCSVHEDPSPIPHPLPPLSPLPPLPPLFPSLPLSPLSPQTNSNLDCCDFSGNTPLHVAAGQGRSPMVSLLIAAGEHSIQYVLLESNATQFDFSRVSRVFRIKYIYKRDVIGNLYTYCPYGIWQCLYIEIYFAFK